MVPGDEVPTRPANRPYSTTPGHGVEIHIVDMPMMAISAPYDEVAQFADLVGLTRDRIPSMSPAEFESFRARALPHLRELERLLNPGPSPA